MKKRILKANYQVIIEHYLLKFCKKQKIKFDYWIGEPLQTASFLGEYAFNVSDIIYDVDYNCPKGLILKWQQDFIEFGDKLNYPSYVAGLRYKDLIRPTAPPQEPSLPII